MTPVFQTQFVATHGKGNCVQAAIASILDLQLEEVPAFRDLPAQEFETAIDAFLTAHGLRRISITFSGAFEWGDAYFNDGLWHAVGKCMLAGPPVLMFGKSPRSDTGHAIVAQMNGANWRLVHDPHPDGTGIAGDPRSIHWIVPNPNTESISKG